MSTFLTLVSGKDTFNAGFVPAVLLLLEENSLIDADDVAWLSKDKAVDINLKREPSSSCISELRRLSDSEKADMFLTSSLGRRKKLLIADMDSTIVAEETLDEIAKHYGIGKLVSEITERSMRGEIDFKTSLRERVALLSGKDSAVLSFVRDDTTLNKGAKTLVQTMAKHGAKCVLISGGFTYFTQYVATLCGFHHHHGNTLQVKKNKISGFVEDPILDASAKSQLMREYMNKYSVKSDDVLAVGDGANDKVMISDAGLGIGYYPKDILREVSNNHILYGDLSAALYAQGFSDNDFSVE